MATVMTRDSSSRDNSAYLEVPLWVWFFTVFTWYDHPFTRVFSVL